MRRTKDATRASAAVKRPGSAARGRTQRAGELSRQQLTRAAVEIADGEGLAGLSIRKLAKLLRVPAMSLYRYVRDKEQLVDWMLEDVLTEDAVNERAAKTWRVQLELAAKQEWKTLRKHPWLTRAFLTDPGSRTRGLAFAERVLRALASSRFDAAGKLRVYLLLQGLVRGLGMHFATDTQAVADTGYVERALVLGTSDMATYPQVSKLRSTLPKSFELAIDRLFEQGLSALLDGLEAKAHGRA